MNRTSLLLATVVVIFLGQPGLAQDKPIASAELKYEPKGPLDGPVCIPLSVPVEFAKLTDVTLQYYPTYQHVLSPRVSGQLTQPSVLTESIPPSAKGQIRRDLHFSLALGKIASSWHVTVFANPPQPAPAEKFAWQKKVGEYAELSFGKTPILRYVHTPYDNSTPANRDKTYKVFHHLYDPSGKRFLTNGGDTNILMPKNPKDNLYPHHRGLMYAFNIITFDGKEKCDTWHAKPGDTHQSHTGFISQEAGAVLGRHRVGVDWHGPKNQVFAKEEREMTVYKMEKGTLVEFASRLKTTGGLVKLQGDPQHSGFQFRAHNDVHEQKNDKQTYYLRPDGKGKLGDTRNWDAKKGGPINLPWDAMSFLIDGKRYSVAYLNNPKNPGESRWSERDYGRFGCYFEYDLTEKNPLVVNYRVWLQDGEMTGEQVEALSKAFTQPPKVTVK